MHHTAAVVAFLLFACAAILTAVSADKGIRWAICLVAAGLAVTLTPAVF